MKNGGKNKSVTFIILFIVIEVGIVALNSYGYENQAQMKLRVF